MKWIPCWSDSIFRAFWNPFTEACEELKYHQVNVTLFCDNPMSSWGLRTESHWLPSHTETEAYFGLCALRTDLAVDWLQTRHPTSSLPSSEPRLQGALQASILPLGILPSHGHTQAGVMESEGPHKGPPSGPIQSHFRPDSSQLREPS